MRGVRRGVRRQVDGEQRGCRRDGDRAHRRGGHRERPVRQARPQPAQAPVRTAPPWGTRSGALGGGHRGMARGSGMRGGRTGLTRCGRVRRPSGGAGVRGRQRARDRQQRQSAEQPVHRQQHTADVPARVAAADVPGEPLAPQRARHPVPAARQFGQPRARLGRAQRPHHGPRGLQLPLHPLDLDRRVLPVQPERVGQFGAADVAGLLQPPQRQQRTVVRVQPAGGLGDLPALVGQSEPQDRHRGEVGGRVGNQLGRVQTGPVVPGRLAGLLAVAHLAYGDGHQPGPEGGGVAQFAEAAHHPQQRLLHHVVHVVVAVERPADDVVDQRQALGDEQVERPLVALAGRDHHLGVRPAPIACHVAPLRVRALFRVFAPLNRRRCHVGRITEKWAAVRFRLTAGGGLSRGSSPSLAGWEVPPAPL